MTDLGNCSHQGDPSLDRGFTLWFDISSDRLVIISLPLSLSRCLAASLRRHGPFTRDET